MKKLIIIVIAVVVIAGIAVQSRSDNTNSPDTIKTNETLDLNTLVDKLKIQYPTIQETKIYTEANDPNNELGKPGKYSQGAAFWDSRTSFTPDSTEPERWGVDAGGSIEVYSSDEEAKKRVEYIEALNKSMPSFLSPGAVKQKGKVVIRASNELPKSQQDEMIDFIAREL